MKKCNKVERVVLLDFLKNFEIFVKGAEKTFKCLTLCSSLHIIKIMEIIDSLKIVSFVIRARGFSEFLYGE